jgi:peroxiredoxin Q/BCP
VDELAAHLPIVEGMPPKPGDKAVDFSLPDQNGERVSLSELGGRKVLVYFYPKADTPGCTTQACGLRDIAGVIGDTVILGISPDTAARLKKFDEKYGLGFTLLSDVDHDVAERYGVWAEKKNYGKTYMGVQRSAFLIDEHGTIEQAWAKISPKDTPTNLLAALES